MGRRRRLGLTAAAAAAAATAGWATLVEPRRLAVRRVDVRPPGWPAALDGLRLVLVSDLHAAAPHVGPRRIGHVAACVRAEQPDLVLLLGDFIDREVTLGRPVAPEAVATALGDLGGRLGAFAVLGNHDWQHGAPRIAAALASAGITVLEDEARPVAGAAAPLWVAGVGDLREHGADVAAALRDVPAGAPVVLLSHDPDVFPGVPARVALTVAGHLHGAQVDVPVVRRRALPSRHGQRYKAGHVVEGGRHLYVTAGVGMAGYPVRLLAPPEVAVLRMRSG